MEILKEILGEELYSQVEQAINAHNGNEANKDKQIKLENINSGNYVSKLKHEDVVNQLSGKDAEIENFKKAIADLQKANKGNEDIQQRISQLETENAQLKAAQEESDRRYAFDVLLMDSGVTDKDEREFLIFKHESKLKEEGKTLELDENKHIKGAEGIIESLKVIRPKAFESASNGDGTGMKVLDPNKLKQGDDRNTVPTKEQFRKMSYEERVALKQSNEQAYKQLAKN